MEKTLFDVIILGSGPAGLTAAIYTSRSHLSTLIIGGAPGGGQLTTTTDVENYPGFPKGIQGPQLISDMTEQALRFDSKLVTENVTEISGNASERFVLKTDSNKTYTAKTIIIATGASARWLPLESVKRLRNKGVSACATCDGFFFKEKITAVVGGGDSAMEEATFLTKYSPKVYIIVRAGQKSMKASKIMQKRAHDNPKIEFMFNTEIKEVLGKDKVEGLLLTNNKTNEETTLTDVQGLFMGIGHKPNTKFLEGFLELNEFGYINPTDFTKTSVPGVFVGGDVGDFRYRQAVTAAGFGCMAALDTEKFLSERGEHEVVSVY